MGNLFKSISSFIDAHGRSATPAAQAPATSQSVPDDADPAQHELPLDGDVIESSAPLPGSGRASRALHAIVRSTATVAVTPRATSLVPMPAQQVHLQQVHAPGGVELTETEHVRLRIMQAQIKLSSLALYEGPINGVMNRDTVTGLRHFQTLKGLRDTGLLTAATLRALMGRGQMRP